MRVRRFLFLCCRRRRRRRRRQRRFKFEFEFASDRQIFRLEITTGGQKEKLGIKKKTGKIKTTPVAHLLPLLLRIHRKTFF